MINSSSSSVKKDDDEEIMTTPHSEQQQPLGSTPPLHHQLIDPEVILSAVLNDPSSFRFASEHRRDDEAFILRLVNELVMHQKDEGCDVIFQFISDNLKNDEEFILSLVKIHGGIYKFISDEFKNDDDITLASLISNMADASIDDFIPNKFRNDKLFIMDGISSAGPQVYRIASHTIKSDRKFALEAIRKNINVLAHVCDGFRNDKTFVLEAFAIYDQVRPDHEECILDKVGDNLKEDKEVVLKVLEKNASEFGHISDVLRSDIDFMRAALRTNGLILGEPSFPDGLKHDCEVVLEAVKSNGYALEFAPRALQDDFEIVLAAVNHSGGAIEHASSELMSNRDIVLAAAEGDGYALAHVPNHLKTEKSFILHAVEHHGEALEYAADELKNDHEIVLSAVKQNGLALQYASELLRQNKEIVTAAVNQKGIALEFAAEFLRDDRDVVLAAARQQCRSLKYASTTLKNDFEIVLAAVTTRGCALQHGSAEMRNNREIVSMATCKFPCVFRFASEELRSDFDFALPLVKRDGDVLGCLSDELKSNFEMILAAMSSYKFSSMHCDVDVLKGFKEFIEDEMSRNFMLPFHHYQSTLLFGMHACAKYPLSMFENKSFSTDSEFHNDVKEIFAVCEASSKSKQKRGNDVKKAKHFGGGCDTLSLSLSRSSPSSSWNTADATTTTTTNEHHRGQLSPPYLLGCEESIYPSSSSSFETTIGMLGGMGLRRLNALGEEGLLEFKKNVAEYAGVQVGPRWNAIKKAHDYLMSDNCF
jgi:hypothetical protein